MKHQLVNVIIGSALLVAATAQAASIPPEFTPFSLVQRNCSPGDITINKSTDPNMTNCLWKQSKSNGDREDSDMQISLHIAADVDTVGMHCTFIPANIVGTARDKVVDVAGSKAALNGGSAAPSQLPQGSWMIYQTNPENGQTEIVGYITKYKNNLDSNSHHQANVIFDLNKERSIFRSNVVFNDQNTLTCEFAPNALPRINKVSM